MERVARSLGELKEIVAGGGEGVLLELFGETPVVALRPPVGGVAGGEGQGTQQFKLPREKDETQAGGMVSPWSAAAQADTIVYPLRKSDRNPFAGVISIGRRLSNDIVLVSGEVSKVHAMIKSRDDGWILSDTGSKNGTFVNFDRLRATAERRLTPGDQVRFGDVQGMFLKPDQLVTLMSLVR